MFVILNYLIIQDRKRRQWSLTFRKKGKLCWLGNQLLTNTFYDRIVHTDDWHISRMLLDISTALYYFMISYELKAFIKLFFKIIVDIIKHNVHLECSNFSAVRKVSFNSWWGHNGKLPFRIHQYYPSFLSIQYLFTFRWLWVH